MRLEIAKTLAPLAFQFLELTTISHDAKYWRVVC
ncbi:hypothetical protein DSM3645_25177 [Blastopirellula marina DSM 3645]|uniref:Uncharacterized protein n=1 Tax=Blastopirellula marina DSM 3645 TaxID=314230 RepID=A4A0A3_9BACT|nr:hypothetical protein DSM3645_25177 [Blastopirellula marina DSM 3645]